jgi:hypothetical protein
LSYAGPWVIDDKKSTGPSTPETIAPVLIGTDGGGVWSAIDGRGVISTGQRQFGA